MKKTLKRKKKSTADIVLLWTIEDFFYQLKWRERERTRTRTRIVYCTSAIGHYTNKGVGVGGVGGGGGHGIKQGKRINKRVGGGGSFAHTENYQFWYNCSVTHSYTYYQEIVFFCLWHEK